MKINLENNNNKEKSEDNKSIQYRICENNQDRENDDGRLIKLGFLTLE